MQATETYTDLPVELRTPYRTIVGNNPVNWIDPYGLAWTKFIPLKWILKKISKIFTGKTIELNPGHPKELDDDDDGIPNFMDPDSEHCEVSCDPIEPNDC